MDMIQTLSQLVNCLRSRGIRRKVAVVCPNDPHTEYVIIRSLREEIAEYLLVTDSAHLDVAWHLWSASPDFIRIYEVATPDDAAALAVQLVRTGEADILMKGLINTDNLLRAVLKKGVGLLPEGLCLFRRPPLSRISPRKGKTGTRSRPLPLWGPSSVFKQKYSRPTFHRDGYLICILL